MFESSPAFEHCQSVGEESLRAPGRQKRRTLPKRQPWSGRRMGHPRRSMSVLPRKVLPAFAYPLQTFIGLTRPRMKSIAFEVVQICDSQRPWAGGKISAVT